MQHVNIEIKARCENPEKIREFLQSQNAEFKGTDYSIDIYFKVKSGRLKLRKGNIENYLISYSREDKFGPKQSNVSLFETSKESNLEELLTNTLGVLVKVKKRREIYFIDNVKFHIDDVKGLGSFVEIEAIDCAEGIGKEELLQQCNKYMESFGIKKEDLVDCSYSDLLIKKS